MNEGKRQRIMGLWNKPELSVREAAEVLEAAAQLAREVPGGLIQLNASDLQSTAESALKRGTEVLERIHAVEQQLLAVDERLYSAIEQAYRHAMDARKTLDARLAQLGELPSIQVPYNITALIEIAERCSNLTDEQWERVVELARALRGD